MSFLDPQIESDLVQAVGDTRSDRLLIGWDPTTGTAVGVWVEVPPGSLPQMRHWNIAGPMPRERVPAWAQDLADQLREALRHVPATVTIN